MILLFYYYRVDLQIKGHLYFGCIFLNYDRRKIYNLFNVGFIFINEIVSNFSILLSLPRISLLGFLRLLDINIYLIVRNIVYIKFEYKYFNFTCQTKLKLLQKMRSNF